MHSLLIPISWTTIMSIQGEVHEGYVWFKASQRHAMS